MDRYKDNRMQDEIDRFLNYEMTPEEEDAFIARMEREKRLKSRSFSGNWWWRLKGRRQKRIFYVECSLRNIDYFTICGFVGRQLVCVYL